MLSDMRDPRRYALAQELKFDIPAHTLSGEELNAALAEKGPQVPITFYPYYRVLRRKKTKHATTV